MSETFIIYDTEYTTWDQALQERWAEPWQHREIVQIGAIRVDKKTMKEIDSFNVYTKPVRNPVLSDFFIDLTKITNEQIAAEGIPFGEGLVKFLDFCTGDVAYAYGWDEVIIGENIAWHDLHPYPIASASFADIAPYIRKVDPNTKGINSGNLASFLNLPIDGGIHAHNALHDCRSILAVLKHGVSDLKIQLPY